MTTIRNHHYRSDITKRFMAKVLKGTPELGFTCWLWLGACQKPDDRYGRFRYEGRSRGAHVVSYLLFKGPIPRGVHHRPPV